MVSKSSEFSRRILSFPAIRPCESVSSSTLLTSLINLAHSICLFKSRTFFTNNKNARNSIHLIETLLVFLEELQTGHSRFEASIVLCLSELHFIFQKVLFLLEDCTRDDAKLWMLMRSERASTHFRELIRAITVALDVFPFAGLENVSAEVEELVELVRKQALKANFEVDKDDRRAMRRVQGILNHFESGIAPESSDLRRVLAHLGIVTWNDCNDEIKLLESETGQECEKRDALFLSSLMAFLIYCRCTLFDQVDNVRENRATQQSGNRGYYSTCLNPDDFRCPITLEIMSDPVTISTGHTYDRSSILKWFKSGNHTCPKTGERLICVDLVPNHALKRLIKQYCLGNGIPFPEQNHELTKSSAGGLVISVAAEMVTKLLSTFLVGKLTSRRYEEQNRASYEIRLLTKTSIFNRSCLVEANAIPPLLNLLSSSTNPGGSSVQENAMAALLNLSKHSKGKRIIAENQGLEKIVDILNFGLKPEARQHAAGALFYLSSVEECRKTIGRISGSIPGLMSLIRDGSGHGKKNALVAILGLLMYPENHWRVLANGLVNLVVNLLRCSEREDLITDSLAVLATLAEKLDGAVAVISAGTLPIILEILSYSDSKAAREYCVSLLLALCINDGADVVPLLVKNPSLMASLYSLLADGSSSRSSKKAGSLIRILHAFSEKSSFSSSSSSSGLAQEQFVHVW